MYKGIIIILFFMFFVHAERGIANNEVLPVLRTENVFVNETKVLSDKEVDKRSEAFFLNDVKEKNVEVNAEKDSLKSPVKLSSFNGILFIEIESPVRITIYSESMQFISEHDLVEKITGIPLTRGVYHVKVGEKIHKVVVEG